MKKFIKKAIEKAPKLGKDKLIEILQDVFFEYEQLEMVLGSIPMGVIVADKKNQIFYVNRFATAYLPFRSGDVIEKNLFEIIDDIDISVFFAKSIGNGDSEPREFVLLKEERKVVLEIRVVPLVSKSHINGNIVLIKDITEHKDKEVQLKRAEKLASLTTLTAGVAHEIKNPLGSISIHIQLIQKLIHLGLDDQKMEKIEKYLDVVNEEIDRLNSTIVDFLFAVRPMDLDRESVDVNEFVKDLVDFLHYECEHEGISCAMNQEKDLPKVKVDIKYLKQAILNIVKNAIAAMHNGGVLSIATYRKESKVCIDFSDTGEGISREDLDKIFEPYYTTKDNGSGLGLTVVYKVLKEMGGGIDVISEKGKGTTFTISLPVDSDRKILLEYEGDKS
jgi:PAS domain S-box-containing protein